MFLQLVHNNKIYFQIPKYKHTHIVPFQKLCCACTFDTLKSKVHAYCIFMLQGATVCLITLSPLVMQQTLLQENKLQTLTYILTTCLPGLQFASLYSFFFPPSLSLSVSDLSILKMKL